MNEAMGNGVIMGSVATVLLCCLFIFVCWCVKIDLWVWSLRRDVEALKRKGNPDATASSHPCSETWDTLKSGSHVQ